MEQKTGPMGTGTPNPLNPNLALDANPSEPMVPVQPTTAQSTPVQPAVSVQPTASAQPTMTQPTPAQPMGVVTDLNGVPTDTSYNPLNRPMEQAVKEAPKKPVKKKSKLVINAIICLLLALGCGVAAALIIANLDRGDVVAQAFGRLISGKAPTNTAVDGTINLTATDDSAFITDAQISLQGELVPSSTINAMSAKINLNTITGRSYSLSASEVYAADGDLYLKLNGFTNLLAEMTAPEISSMFEVVDGEWIRIPTDSLGTVPGLGENSVPTCTANFVMEFTNNSNSLIGAYNRTPFIGSTTENLKVTSEKDPIYLITLDQNNLASFLDNSIITTAMKNYSSCLAMSADQIDSGAEIAKNIVEMTPEFYVEIDKDYNFTRFYTETTADDTNVRVDIRFSYPDNVNISEPGEYKDFSTLWSEIFGQTEEFNLIEERGDL